MSLIFDIIQLMKMKHYRIFNTIVDMKFLFFLRRMDGISLEP